MTDNELHDLIAGDAQAKALADAGDDAGAAARASAIAPEAVAQCIINERTVFAAFPNPADGEAVMATLEAVADADPVQVPHAPIVARAVRWLRPGEGGLDVGHPSTRAMLDALTGQGQLTAERVAVVKALAEQPQTITAEQVSRAWERHRPDGRIAS